jgi:hypothetical protein
MQTSGKRKQHEPLILGYSAWELLANTTSSFWGLEADVQLLNGRFKIQRFEVTGLRGSTNGGLQ